MIYSGFNFNYRIFSRVCEPWAGNEIITSYQNRRGIPLTPLAISVHQKQIIRNSISVLLVMRKLRWNFRDTWQKSNAWKYFWVSIWKSLCTTIINCWDIYSDGMSVLSKWIFRYTRNILRFTFVSVSFEMIRGFVRADLPNEDGIKRRIRKKKL